MKRITHKPSGRVYEVEDGWQELGGYPLETDILVLYVDGEVHRSRVDEMLGPITKHLYPQWLLAWKPIVTPKVVEPERWRAEKNQTYYVVLSDGDIVSNFDLRTKSDDDLYQNGNYFRTHEEAQGSFKYRIMNDPNANAYREAANNLYEVLLSIPLDSFEDSDAIEALRKWEELMPSVYFG